MFPNAHPILKKAAVLALCVLITAAFFISCSVMTGSPNVNFEGLPPKTTAKDPIIVTLAPGSTASTTQSNNTPDTQAPSATTAKDSETTKPPVVYRNPLTGLVASKKTEEGRPISICIGNTAAGMPQYGLSCADILVEAGVEGGLTRLMMITSDVNSLPRIGSVRSTRNCLLQLSADFGAVAAYAGTYDTGTDMVTASCDSLDYIGHKLSSTFYRDENRSSPHNLMTDGTRLYAQMEKLKYTARDTSATLPYKILTDTSQGIAMSGGAATAVNIPFSQVQQVSFTYDAMKNVYLRYQNGAAHTDGWNAEQLTYKNLLLLFCDTVTYETPLTTNVELDINTSGTGYYVSGGRFEQISWTRESGKLIIYNKAEELLTVCPGNTYIGLIRCNLADKVSLN